MKKIIFGIFAHPDDEAFGPSGTLIKEVRSGTELHLITLTAGDAGMNPDGHDDLGVVRLDEWRAAGDLIGASSMHHLGYKDGALNNASLQSAAEVIEGIVMKTIGTANDISIEFMSFDLNGISGHIDHIVASRAACLVFYRLKKSDPRFTRIRLFCISDSQLATINTDWLYMEPGRCSEDINETIDASDVHDQIVTIIKTHHTQRSDGEAHLERMGDNIGINHYIVLE